MKKKEIFLGNTKIVSEDKSTSGAFVEIEGEMYYRIGNYDLMPDFFMTIVSNADHWMYISSNGSLTAGRKNRDHALFPYYTSDKIHDYRNQTGSSTCILVQEEVKTHYWEPFSSESKRYYKIQRNLYKSIFGNKVIFEEINYDLKISYKYAWYNSDYFGWVKKSTIKYFGKDTVKIDFLDGIRNILPHGVNFHFQNEYSNLSDAYKKNELIEPSQLALFSLSSIPVDKAEPSEALKTTSVWSFGLEEERKILLSDKQLENFKYGNPLQMETDVRASKGCYYINASLNLQQEECRECYFVAEVDQDATAVANLDLFIRTEKQIKEKVEQDIAKGTNKLRKIVASADGLQIGNEKLSFARHFSNTLFNVMRGGVYLNAYQIEVADFALYMKQQNLTLYLNQQNQLNGLPESINYSDLIQWAQSNDDPDLERISLEYLPLSFSRRHGDPSRPWNQFSIELKNPDGTEKLNYQGNWRDIFQNWETLNLSFPEYIESIISKFLNASTADGYNPYRITRDGIDWESPDPADPWAYIGYWGDHQIIYLQKFLEQSEAFHPGRLDDLMDKEIFVYANVPYRIKAFEELVKDPKNTISFDHDLNNHIEERTKNIGADGKLLYDKNGGLQKANLLEKILVSLLAKMSNFIPEAGIWLNTQRPEWNDANNALVGNGVSMVTLYYMCRFLKFWEEKLQTSSLESVNISKEVMELFENTHESLLENAEKLKSGFSNAERYRFLEKTGKAGSNYRDVIYKQGFSGLKSGLSIERLKAFIAISLEYMDQSIAVNRRQDGLYHAYNLVSFANESISIRHLYEMLEGQVAVLSSGQLSVEESLKVLDALKASKLFREDQYSYLLYPDRKLPRFIEKNNIPPESIQGSKLLMQLLSDGNISIITKDENDNYHFNGDFRNASVLEEQLEKLEEPYKDLLAQEKEKITSIYEEVFDHQSFTGRSGTFYGYEGLGSIYWHMVSKLLLACQECYFRAIQNGGKQSLADRIKDHYYEIKAGIGLYKSPELYGAFPTDAYSHTPGNAGVKQPGLTGQVKEDVISRSAELGIIVEKGKISFCTSLLNHNEFLQSDQDFHFIAINGERKTIPLNAGQLAFTFCQVPIIYTRGSSEKIKVTFSNNSKEELDSNALPLNWSSSIFSRKGEIEKIEFIVKS